MRRTRFAATAALLAAALAVISAPVTSAQPQPPPPPIQTNWLQALGYSLTNPEVEPVGMNVPGCVPSPSHPRPLILVNGTFENSYTNWSYFAPQLAADGYCVFGFNYGGAQGSPIQQTGNMRSSARELSDFVDKVRAETGSAKVDLVGHSQGGLLPLYYINVLDGADKVDTYVGVEPASNGVALYGILPIVQADPLLRGALGLILAASIDFTADSEFLRDTAAQGLTRPQVRYASIISSNSILISVPEAHIPPAPNVTNIVLQDVCAQDYADHVTVVYDDITLDQVRRALDATAPATATCHLVLPLVTQAPPA
ncbi:hypothetical protein BJD99_04495 [Rhodococcus sp. 1163]|nr:hypothetical protein BJD99_04495 [Rhodococcus sp. 1163]